MTNYLVSYATDSTTAATVVYGVENYEDLFELAIRDFFDYATGEVDENDNDILESSNVMRKFVETGEFYLVCSDSGVYFGDIIPVEEALKYATTLAEFN
jgi:hypothetical protein